MWARVDRQLTGSSWLLLVLVVGGGGGGVASLTGDDGTRPPATAFYTDRWAVQVRGGEHVARRLAALHGFQFIAKVTELSFVFVCMYRAVEKCFCCFYPRDTMLARHD